MDNSINKNTPYAEEIGKNSITQPLIQGQQDGMDESNYPPSNYNSTEQFYVRVDDLNRTNEVANKYVHEMELAARHGFVRKVLGIVFCQVLFTLGTVLLFMYNSTVNNFAMQQHNFNVLFYSSIVVSIASICAMVCMGRIFPYNYILLFLFTTSESIMVSFAALNASKHVVAMAMVATAGIVGALMLFASQTKYDFTGYQIYLYVALNLMFLLAIISSFGHMQGAQVMQAGIGTLIFSGYLVVDMQMILAGAHRLQFGLDDYAFAALNIYLDILNLFLYILQLFGDRN